MISHGENEDRLFIDISDHGCRSGCKYCYVKHVQKEQLLSDSDLERIPGELEAHPKFNPGPKGTLLTFGSHTDIFQDDELVAHFLKALRLVVPLNNPIQLATKQPIQKSWAVEIGKCNQYSSQMTIFTSFSSVSQSHFLEPGSPDVYSRAQNFKTLREENVHTCFFIKPVIPGITDRETDAFISLIQDSQPDTICLGSLYLNPVVEKKLKLVDKTEISESRNHPLMPRTYGVIDVEEGFFERIRDACQPIKTFKSSSCVCCYYNKLACPINIKTRFQHLCVDCGIRDWSFERQTVELGGGT